MKKIRIAQLLHCFIAVKEKNNLTMKQCSNRKPSQGFTLIEFLVVIVLIGALASMTVATFFDYYHSQILQTGANEVVAMLNLAKSNALSQVKNPSLCGPVTVLEGYRVTINNSSDYVLDVMCSGTPFNISSKALPANVTFTSPTPSSFLFTVLIGNVVGSSTITISGFGKTKDINVSSTGVIN